MSGHGGQGGRPRGRSDTGASNSTRAFIFPWGAAFGYDTDRMWKLFLELGQHLAPTTNMLYRAVVDLMAANNAVAVDVDGAVVQLATAKEAYAVACRLNTNMCVCFVPKN